MNATFGLSYTADSYTVNSTAVFSCVLGWKVAGGQQVHVCGHDGQWHCTKPYCIGTSFHKLLQQMVGLNWTDIEYLKSH